MHVSKVAIDSTLPSLTQACSNPLSRSQASLLSELVFKEFFARVSTAIQGCSDKFAGELLSKDLINWEVVNDLAGTLACTHSYAKISEIFMCRSKQDCECKK